MRINVLNRMLVASTVIGAVSLAGVSVTANAPRPPRQEQKKQSDAQRPDPKKAKPQKHEEQKSDQQARREQNPLPTRPHQQASRNQQRQPQGRLTPQQQRQRIGEHQRELAQYRAQLDQQRRTAAQQSAALQRQHRTAQYAYQQQYIARLDEQRAGVQYGGSYDYGGDPYFSTPPSYRYVRDGRYFETNEYGAVVLRQAVNNSYAQGLEAGRADRMDRWAYNYGDSYAYRDGIYGYRGFYVPRSDYRYYFRQGFRRGYDDGYHERRQYGVRAGGGFSVLGGVLSVIINLQPIR